MSNAQTLKQRYEEAEAKALKLQAEKDDAIAKVRSRYADKLSAAADTAAAAQKEWLDAEAVELLRDRPDGDQVAEALGLSLEG